MAKAFMGQLSGFSSKSIAFYCCVSRSFVFRTRIELLHVGRVRIGFPQLLALAV